jgi:HSP20 family protein
MERFNPFRDTTTLRQAMDRLLEESFVRPGGRTGTSESDGGFPLDVRDRDDHLDIRASLPGVKPEDVQVTTQGDTLTIRGETRSENEEKTGRWVMREHKDGVMERTVTLPYAIDVGSAEARYEHGVLRLTLPKAAKAMPQKIKVGTAKAPNGKNPSVVDPTKPEATHPAHVVATKDRPEGDQVTAESEESFPASDPPSWTPERA